MKLTNPTDNELDAQFALKVVGQPTADPYCRSADAVLPWLTKRNWNSWNQGKVIYVGVYAEKGEFQNYAPVGSDSFPRSAVLALLQQKGVEVEYTK